MQKADRKVYIVGVDNLVHKMFNQMDGFSLVDNIEDSDIVVFTGGEDVTPGLYGAQTHPETGFNPMRDLEEMTKYAAAKGKFKVGICRGSQFLCVMNGGSLYQDVDNHALYSTHDCFYTDEDGLAKSYKVTSTHHQMQNPFTSSSTYEVWGEAYEATYRDLDKQVCARLEAGDHPDVEIVYWPESRSLGFQPHPEYGSESTLDLFKICLNRALGRN